jgi:hypothetical protein
VTKTQCDDDRATEAETIKEVAEHEKGEVPAQDTIFPRDLAVDANAASERTKLSKRASVARQRGRICKTAWSVQHLTLLHDAVSGCTGDRSNSHSTVTFFQTLAKARRSLSYGRRGAGHRAVSHGQVIITLDLSSPRYRLLQPLHVHRQRLRVQMHRHGQQPVTPQHSRACRGWGWRCSTAPHCPQLERQNSCICVVVWATSLNAGCSYLIGWIWSFRPILVFSSGFRVNLK